MTGCTSGRGAARPSTSEHSSVSPSPRFASVAATAGYVLDGAFAPSAIQPGVPRALLVSKRDNSQGQHSSIIVFPLLPTKAECVEAAAVQLRLIDGAGSIAHLAVYPSLLWSLAHGRRPAKVQIPT